MSGIPVRRKGGVQSFEVAENVVGGQLVEARAASQVGVAGADSAAVLGVAIADAVPVGSFDAAPVNGVLNAAPQPNRVGIAHAGDEVPVTYAAAADFGVLLVAAANGQVTPFVPAAAGAAPNAHLIVGRCVEPAGVAAGAVGLTWIA